MGSVDRVDDRTFRANFSAEGVVKLRDRVKDKLKEFMGDYTDDTLVEYVIVLLRNGRRKEEAINELNVFLGDDSDSFVSWLWDHLSASLDMYLQSQDSHVEEATKTKSMASSEKENDDFVKFDSESERGKSNKLSNSRHKRQWTGLARDDAGPPPLASSEVHNIHFEKNDPKVKCERRSPSPQPRSHRKRSLVDDRQHEQREANHFVPRRLLKSAVRDALATSKLPNSTKEPSLKRLRSVVSTSTKDSSTAEPPRRVRSVARVLNPMATVIKAVEEAAEDARKIKPGRSVFDRISHSTDESKIPDQHAEFGEAVDEIEDYEFNKHKRQIQSRYTRRLDYNVGYDESMTMSEIGLGADIIADRDRLDDPSFTSHEGVGVPLACMFGVIKDDDPIQVQHSVAVQACDFRRVARNNYQNQPMEATTRHKIVSVSGNIDPCKPPNNEQRRHVPDVDSRKSLQESMVGATEAIMRSTKDNNSPVAVGNGNVKPAADIRKDPLKGHMPSPGTYSAIRLLEDADSRIIFVSNVHFGATKDSLSRHFNKFGEVLKVIMVTDPATGQPTGSAYVEFMRKEAADSALSLDGTSFMSRILKIVKRSSSQQEAAPTMTWSRATRGTPHSVTRFPRGQFPRGAAVTSAFRGRPPVRPGARSLQWKRDAPATPADTAAASSSSGPGNSTSAYGARSLTYVRTADTKSDMNASATT